jgi:hypothetical protein
MVVRDVLSPKIWRRLSEYGKNDLKEGIRPEKGHKWI